MASVICLHTCPAYSGSFFAEFMNSTSAKLQRLTTTLNARQDTNQGPRLGSREA